MRTKLIKYFLLNFIIVSFIISLLFYIVSNYENEETVKLGLKRNNEMLISILNNENLKTDNTSLHKSLAKLEIRITLIDKYGKVNFDSLTDEKEMNNHNDRKEVYDARTNGFGFSIRFSDTLNKNMMYYATEFNSGEIIRSSIQLDRITGLNNIYIKYYIGIFFLAIAFSSFLSYRASKAFLIPIKKLEYTTSLISNGNFDQRVKIYSKDEIGQLGKTFNSMADIIQATLNDAIDKQNRLQAILSSMDNGVIAIDRENRVIMINPYSEKIFGIEKKIIGEKLIDSIRDVDFENIFEDSKGIVKEIKILWPKERELRIKTAEIINNNEIIGKVAVVNDVTDLKKLENLRSQFVANVSHELKTPLTSIKGFAETLKFVNDEEKKVKFLDIINEEADRLTSLINDILILSDIEQNKRFAMDKIDVKKVIKDVFNLVKPLADKKEVLIDVECEDMPKLTGDRDKFKQMLINLCDNAIKYSEKGDKVKILGKVIDNNIRIKIEDTGIGIEEKNVSRLFERFYRVDTARSRAKGGTGLGLAIVKHIVMNFNGTIEVQSKLNVGSKFIIRIPISHIQKNN